MTNTHQQQEISTEPGFGPYKSLLIDTLKIRHQPHGFKVMTSFPPFTSFVACISLPDAILIGTCVHFRTKQKTKFVHVPIVSFQTSNPVINLDHDDDWVLQPGRTLQEAGVVTTLHSSFNLF